MTEFLHSASSLTMTNKISFSRRDTRPRHAMHRVKKTPLSTIASRLSRRWDRFLARLCSANTSPGFAALNPGYKEIRKQNAARRMSSDGPHRRQVYAVCANHVLRVRRRQVYAVCAHKIHAARSPDGVPPRHLRPRTNAAARLQNAFLGRICRRALSAVSYPSPATKSQTGHHAGQAFPVSHRGAEVTSATRGNRSCPIGRRHPVNVLCWARFAQVTEVRTNVNAESPSQ